MSKMPFFGAAAISMILCACTTNPIADYRQNMLDRQLARAKVAAHISDSDTVPPAPAPYPTATQTPSTISAQSLGAGDQFARLARNASLSRAVSRPEPTYSGPHNYSTTRGNTYGYTSAETGQVHFFRYDGIRNGRHVLISFEDTTASMVSCEGACTMARITGYGFDRTYEVKRNSVLASVIQDMLRGALTPSQ